MRDILLLIFAGAVTYVTAQVPGLGWCPEYAPMNNFDLDRYLGVWYEAERYFTVLEAGSRCVRSNYTKGAANKFRVSNEITNRLTGIRRVLDGVVQNIGRGGEGKIAVKYNTLPVPIDTQYSVLDTDYDTYSVVWSCSSLGPINTQNAWVMTRDRLAPGTVLQTAYGVLDKYKISRTFFVKTDQADCVYSDENPQKELPKSESLVPEEPKKPEESDKDKKRDEVMVNKEEMMVENKKPVMDKVEPERLAEKPMEAEKKPMKEEMPVAPVEQVKLEKDSEKLEKEKLEKEKLEKNKN